MRVGSLNVGSYENALQYASELASSPIRVAMMQETYIPKKKRNVIIQTFLNKGFRLFLGQPDPRHGGLIMIATAIHISIHAQRAKEKIEMHRTGQLLSLIASLCTPKPAAEGEKVAPNKIGAVIHNHYGESGKEDDTAVMAVLDFASQFTGAAPQVYGGDLNVHNVEEL